MNQTKKITHGAMLLALIGAILLIDRYLLAYYFDELVFILQAIAIILYACKYTMREGFTMSFGMVVLTLLFGGTLSYVYCPLAIITGLWYSYGLKKKMGGFPLALSTMLIFIIGEFVIGIAVMPILGISIDDLAAGSMEAFDKITETIPGLYVSEELKKTLLSASIAMSFVLLGTMEGLIVHLFSLFLLKKFRIAEVAKVSLDNLKIPDSFAYVLAVPIFTLFFLSYFEEGSTISTVLMFAGILAGFVLVIFGFVFLIRFGKIIHKNLANIALLLVVLVPYLLVTVAVLGFLYLAGPLQRLIENKNKGDIR